MEHPVSFLPSVQMRFAVCVLGPVVFVSRVFWKELYFSLEKACFVVCVLGLVISITRTLHSNLQNSRDLRIMPTPAPLLRGAGQRGHHDAAAVVRATKVPRFSVMMFVSS